MCESADLRYVIDIFVFDHVCYVFNSTVPKRKKLFGPWSIFKKFLREIQHFVPDILILDIFFRFCLRF